MAVYIVFDGETPNRANNRKKSSMCQAHGAEFTKLKTSYIYFDDMIVLTKSEK